jgi:deazaflavin-dependent oxidoreductase (nitroreductase family)
MTADGIPANDPSARGDVGTRIWRLVFAIKPLGDFVIWVARYVDPLLHRLTRGPFGGWIPMPFVSMTTTGAKSGLPRTSAVIYFSDGADLILVASNYGGTRHPAWYHNLKANPTARLVRGRHSANYAATEVTDEAERQRLFAQADRVYRGYAGYREQTAVIGRRIPIMRLRRTQS